jgi:putative endonuclease
MNTYYVYIVSSKPHWMLYIWVTNTLVRRIHEHKEWADKTSFTSKYSVDRLVWYERTTDVNAAIKREKQLKKRKRQWKINLIEEKNLYWEDLYDSIGLNDNDLLGFLPSQEWQRDSK